MYSDCKAKSIQTILKNFTGADIGPYFLINGKHYVIMIININANIYWPI